MRQAFGRDVMHLFALALTLSLADFAVAPAFEAAAQETDAGIAVGGVQRQSDGQAGMNSDA